MNRKGSMKQSKIKTMTGDCPACSGCGVNQKLRFKLRLFACGMLLAATLFCCLFVPIHSDAASINTVRIATKAEWLEFKENCRLDSFSKGLSVKLTADIDLSGETDYAVPVFFGNFDGGGHTVSGMKPNTDAERTGLFRIIEKDATVCELNVSGSVTVTGQSGTAGMICGVNRGTIRNCAAAGRLDAYNAVGGIAGINEQSGKKIDCCSSAELSGTYKIGGIVGEYGYDFMDLDKSYAQIGIDDATDFSDGEHMNVNGMEKFTTYLGQYIVDNYDVARSDSGYTDDIKADWDACYEKTMGIID